MMAEATPFERYVQLPLIFLAFLRAEGWSVAAYPHNGDERAWCLKVKKTCVANIDADGGLTFKNMSLADQRAFEAVRDRARAAFVGLLQARDEFSSLTASPGPDRRRARRRSRLKG